MDFFFFVKEGFFHVLDFNALDHILFFIAVSMIFTLKEWKKALWLVTFFTLGHTFTFTLSVYDWIKINGKWVEFLIPITILIPILVNNYSVYTKTTSLKRNYYFTFFFGLIHGLGFSSYFKMLLDDDENKFIPLLEFSLGIEFVQVLIVGVIILLNSIWINKLHFKQQIWIGSISILLLFKIIPMLINRYPF